MLLRRQGERCGMYSTAMSAQRNADAGRVCNRRETNGYRQMLMESLLLLLLRLLVTMLLLLLRLLEWKPGMSFLNTIISELFRLRHSTMGRAVSGPGYIQAPYRVLLPALARYKRGRHCPCTGYLRWGEQFLRLPATNRALSPCIIRTTSMMVNSLK